jgi:hypothetical protein
MSITHPKYNDLILMEGKIEYEKTLTQEKLKRIIEARKKVENAISQLNSKKGLSSKDLTELDVTVDFLVQSSKSKNKGSGQVVAFVLGFITALFMLPIIGL